MWDFEVLNQYQVNATIPAAVPSGEVSRRFHNLSIQANVDADQYLLRAEQIGLLIYLEPQYYVSCAQVKIVNGGDGKPPLVAIPGHFQPDGTYGIARSSFQQLTPCWL